MRALQGTPSVAWQLKAGRPGKGLQLEETQLLGCTS